MSPRPSPCDGFTGMLPAFADRELGPAESTGLERHLDGCPHCHRRLREIETVGNVLKGWDGAAPEGTTAAARLQHAVLARIEEDGQRRRGELRRLRFRRFALAASVLLAVGAPLVVALRARSQDATAVRPASGLSLANAGSPAAPATQAADPAPTTPSAGGLAPEQRAFRPWDGQPVEVESPSLAMGDREALLRAALQPQKDLLLEAQFRATVGVAGVWVVDALTGSRLLLTPEAAQFFAREERLSQIRAQAAELLTGEATREPRSLDLSAAAVLEAVLSGDEGTSEWRARSRAVFHYRRASASEPPALSAWPLARREADRAGATLEALDPLTAADLKLLRFEPSGHDVTTVVAVVEGTALPVLIPAGQLLAGGETDRVVARATWLPASSTRLVVEIPCAVVRSGTRRAEQDIRITPWVAGPSLRALLAEGASGAVVLEHARRLWGSSFGGRTPLEWSLLDLYSESKDGAALTKPELVGFSEQAPAGFLVVDGVGRFLGLEHVSVAGEYGARLLRRLLHGYAKEAEWRRTGADSALAVPGEAAATVITRLRTLTTPLVVPPVAASAQVPGAERATLNDPSAGLSVEALRIGTLPVWVSVVPSSALPGAPR